jgi:hypothetical protein
MRPIMGVASSIQIVIQGVENTSFSKIVLLLTSAGWGFGNRTVCFQHQVELEPMEDDLTASISELPRVLEQLDRWEEAGEYVEISLYWHEDEQHLRLVGHRQGNIALFFDGTRPTLACAPRYTDFSLVLTRVLCPLYSAGCNIRSIVCSDDD